MFVLLCPLRSVSANAMRLRLSSLVVSRTVPPEQCDALLCANIARKFKSQRPNDKIKKHG